MLTTALDICRADKATATQTKSMSLAATQAKTSTDEAEVKPIRTAPRSKTFRPTKQLDCGTHGPFQECSARGADYLKCRQRDHFAQVC